MAITGKKTSSNKDSNGNYYIKNNNIKDMKVIDLSEQTGFTDPTTVEETEYGIINYSGGVLPDQHIMNWEKSGSKAVALDSSGYPVISSDGTDNAKYRFYNPIDSSEEDCILQAKISCSAITGYDDNTAFRLGFEDGAKDVSIYFRGSGVTEGIYYKDSSGYTLIAAESWSDGTERTYKFVKTGETSVEFFINGTTKGTITYSNFADTYFAQERFIEFGCKFLSAVVTINVTEIKFDLGTAFSNRTSSFVPKANHYISEAKYFEEE